MAGARLRALPFSFATLSLLLAPAPAPATAPPETTPIVDRNYSVDLYEGVVFGSPRLVAMGGATFAVGEGASGLFTNPASAAVRPTTPTSRFEWSAFFNSYIPSSGTDYNNNGAQTTEYRRSAVYAPGLILQPPGWGIALNVSYVRHESGMTGNPGGLGGLGARSIIAHLGAARTFFGDALSVGLAIRAGSLNVYTREGSNGLFTQVGGSAEAGVVYRPKSLDARFALAGALPVYAGAIQTECDPKSCFGYILPRSAVVPWTVVLGSGWRIGAGRWNERVATEYRDVRQLIVGLDLLLVGPVDGAYSLEEMAVGRLQPSGRNLTASPRFGAEVEIIPGWWRLRGGTYFEPSRHPGIGGRLHGTAGTEVRVLGFRLGGEERRLSIALAGDFADRYYNAGVSIGFWN